MEQRRLAWSAMAIVGTILVAWQGWGMASQRPASTDSSGLWISESHLDDGRKMLVVVDQATRHVAVYHLDGTNGTLTLRSTRDISYDLMVGDFNAQEPRPNALRKMLQAPGVGDPPR